MFVERGDCDAVDLLSSDRTSTKLSPDADILNGRCASPWAGVSSAQKRRSPPGGRTTEGST